MIYFELMFTMNACRLIKEKMNYFLLHINAYNLRRFWCVTQFLICYVELDVEFS